MHIEQISKHGEWSGDKNISTVKSAMDMLKEDNVIMQKAKQ